MKINIGQIDKNIRIALAVVLLAFVSGGVITGIKAIIGGILAIVFFITALTRFCPLYKIFKMDTCNSKSENTTDSENPS